jgi:hypothetical protein
MWPATRKMNINELAVEPMGRPATCSIPDVEDATQCSQCWNHDELQTHVHLV